MQGKEFIGASAQFAVADRLAWEPETFQFQQRGHLLLFLDILFVIGLYCSTSRFWWWVILSIFFRVPMHQWWEMQARDETQTTKWWRQTACGHAMLTAGCMARDRGMVTPGPLVSSLQPRVPSAGGRAGSSAAASAQPATVPRPAVELWPRQTGDLVQRPGNSSVDSRASNEFLRRFHNHGEGEGHF